MSLGKYSARRSPRRGVRRVGIIGLVLLCILLGAVVIVRRVYYDNLKAVSSSSQVALVTVQTGATSNDIADLLKKQGLIRSATIFEWYIRSKDLRSQLQAGTYALKPNMDVPTIVDALVHGKIAANLVTIVPGQRLDQVRATFVKAGFSESAVNAALNPSNYSSYVALADKPASADLEGFLYPDSFQKNEDTDPEVIVKESLTEMGQHLTPNIRAAFAKQGLTVYQGITLASIIEQEVSRSSDRAQAAQVFLSRLNLGMSLGSDVTAFYGAIKAGASPSTTYDSPYNTLLHKGLPPGPISNVSDASLQAVAHPANTDWLYFVTGDNGITYFSKTLQEHEALTQQYCHKLCTSAQ